MKSKKVKGTKQQFISVDEEPKLKVKNIKCKNAKQKEFLNLINEKEIIIASGPAGVGKSYLALYAALKLLEKEKFKKITLVKSVTPLPDEELGYLPGNQYEKMEPFLMSYFGNIDKLIGEEERKRLVGKKIVDIQPLMFVRGVNLDDQIVIIDEVQNLNLHTFKTIITRIGSNSKYIIMGDAEQSDRRKSDSCLSKVLDLFKDDELVGTIQFTDEDQVRNPIIPHLLEKIRTIE